PSPLSVLSRPTPLPLYPLHASFCQRHGDLRDLHSFPTRRSSDLRTGIRDRASGIAPDAGREQREIMKFLAVVEPPEPMRGLEVPDRKSTRLNSSHVKISYAVFCLKKKKKSQRQAPHGVARHAFCR